MIQEVTGSQKGGGGLDGEWRVKVACRRMFRCRRHNMGISQYSRFCFVITGSCMWLALGDLDARCIL